MTWPTWDELRAKDKDAGRIDEAKVAVARRRWEEATAGADRMLTQIRENSRLQLEAFYTHLCEDLGATEPDPPPAEE